MMSGTDRPPYARISATLCKAYARMKNHPCMGFVLLSQGIAGAMQGMQGKRSLFLSMRNNQIISSRARISKFDPCMPCIALQLSGSRVA